MKCQWINFEARVGTWKNVLHYHEITVYYYETNRKEKRLPTKNQANIFSIIKIVCGTNFNIPS